LNKGKWTGLAYDNKIKNGLFRASSDASGSDDSGSDGNGSDSGSGSGSDSMQMLGDLEVGGSNQTVALPL
jgi:hypothetical protein